MALPAKASLRGPSFGNTAPAQAADVPRAKIVMLNAHAVSVKVQPS